jgi:hypothetical protein
MQVGSPPMANRRHARPFHAFVGSYENTGGRNKDTKGPTLSGKKSGPEWQDSKPGAPASPSKGLKKRAIAPKKMSGKKRRRKLAANLY